MRSVIKKFIQFAIVLSLTTAILFLIIIGLKGKAPEQIGILEIVELFIAIPLLASIYYLLVSAKFDEFHRRLRGIERELGIKEKELKSEEKTLKQEIRELKEVVSALDDRIRKLKKTS